MLLGPIFSLELVTGARRARYFWVRIAYALVLFFTLWVTYQTAVVQNNLLGIQGVANIARDFFTSFAIIQLIAVLVLTPAMVAGTIAQERERRTLEYLLTSQLSSSDIILGKLGARLLHVVFVLLAGIPVLAAAMLLGGIPPLALVVANTATLLTLVAVGALSIAVSVWRRRTRDAIVSAYVLLFGVLVIPPMGASFHGAATHAPWQQIVDGLAGVCKTVSYANPFLVVAASASSNFQRLIGGGWPELLAVEASYLGFAALCLLAAVLNVRRAYSNDASRVARPRWWNSLYWRPAVGRNPMLWKELFAESAAGRLGWLGRTVIGLLLLFMIGPTLVGFFEVWASSHAGAAPEAQAGNFVGIVKAMSNFLGCFGLLILTARAATLVTSEKERDCWVSLLSTPLSAAEVVSAKLLGNLYAGRWFGLLLGLVLLLAVLIDPGFLVASLAVGMTWLLLACYGSCLGLTFSLWMRNSTRAMAAAMATAVFFGGFYLMFVWPIYALIYFGTGGAGNPAPEPLLSICIPFLLAYPGIYWHGAAVGGERDLVLAAYVSGMLIYAAVSSALWRWNIRTFDKRAGRMREQ